MDHGIVPPTPSMGHRRLREWLIAEYGVSEHWLLKTPRPVKGQLEQFLERLNGALVEAGLPDAQVEAWQSTLRWLDGGTDPRTPTPAVRLVLEQLSEGRVRREDWLQPLQDGGPDLLEQAS